MLSRWFFLAVVGVVLFTYMNHADGSGVKATISQACSPSTAGAATVTLAWPQPPSGAQSLRLDLGLAEDFPAGSFQSYGPLPPAQTAHVIDGVPSGLRFHYRIVSADASGAETTVASGAFTSKCEP